ncbi:hypothetical protein ABG768_014006 [Culter alburnus]|uniref:Uncharacterized protein n=1 Tax=Culter alburnus TaxID=194366 RepID=A0AAW1Z772_CULAL
MQCTQSSNSKTLLPLNFTSILSREGKRGRDKAGAERRIPWGIASETKDMKKIPTGVSEAGDDAWSREIPPPSSRSLELYSGSGRRKGGGRHSSVITKFMQKSRSVEAFK